MATLKNYGVVDLKTSRRCVPELAATGTVSLLSLWIVCVRLAFSLCVIGTQCSYLNSKRCLPVVELVVKPVA